MATIQYITAWSVALLIRSLASYANKCILHASKIIEFLSIFETSLSVLLIANCLSSYSDVEEIEKGQYASIQVTFHLSKSRLKLRVIRGVIDVVGKKCFYIYTNYVFI